MSNFNWCHGPKCHTYQTQDRVRGSKGSKVLRTRKVKETQWNHDSFYKYFCNNICYNNFASKHADRIVAIAPRHEALETPIEDPKKVTNESRYGGYHYTHTEIKEKIDTQTE